MVIWVPGKLHRLRRVYDRCVAMGAPRFTSPEDMNRWLSENLDVVEAYYNNRFHIRLELLIGDSIIGLLVKVLDKIHLHNGRINELTWLTFKALHTPLLLNPRSLHPIDSVA